jgi:YD repeat-containing protein
VGSGFAVVWESRVVFGVPADLRNPDQFAPSPWTVTTYDANDNAGRTHPAEAAAYADHFDTPATTVFDALGRAVEVIARSSPGDDGALRTRTRYDVLGHVIAIIDAEDRTAYTYVRDVAGRALATEALDTGRATVVFDAAGAAVEARDARGALVLTATDELGRTTRVWARDAAATTGAPLTLRQRLVYGDDGGDDPGDAVTPAPFATRADAAAAHALGRVVAHYDEAGRATFEYDARGRLVGTERRCVTDAIAWDTSAAGAAIDWTVPSGSTRSHHRPHRLGHGRHRRHRRLRPPRGTRASSAASRRARVAGPGDPCSSCLPAPSPWQRRRPDTRGAARSAERPSAVVPSRSPGLLLADQEAGTVSP